MKNKIFLILDIFGWVLLISSIMYLLLLFSECEFTNLQNSLRFLSQMVIISVVNRGFNDYYNKLISKKEDNL